MGVVRYLCITILLVSLAFVAADDCSGNGWLTPGATCVCNSGFDQADCSNNFGTCNSTYPAGTYSEHWNKDTKLFPKLDEVNHKITFTQNYLQLSIVGPIVPDRKYTNVAFIDQTSDMCKLNGTNATSYWTQRNSGFCQDEFHLNMPWTAWESCGFGPHGGKDIGDFWEYKATFVIYYVDNIGQPFKFDDIAYQPVLYRHSTVAFKVWVHFKKIIEIEISQVLINSTIDLAAAITKFEYNPSNQILTLGIMSFMTWPNMYIRDTVSVSIINSNSIEGSMNTNKPLTTTGLIAYPVNDNSLDSCDGSAGAKYYRKNCMQYFEMYVHLVSGCDFNADYLISGTARTCRDGDLTAMQAGECTNATQQYQLKVSKSDVCGSVTANPLITGKLVSYDGNHQLQDEFVIGYKGYFEVEMQTLNSFNMTWIEIWAVADTVPGEAFSPPVQYLYRDGQVQLEGFKKFDNSPYPQGTFQTSPVQLNVHTITQNMDNTDTIVYTPKFDFVFDSRIFHIEFTPNGEVKRGFTIHATGRVVYEGNEGYNSKRAEEVVDFVWESSAKDMNTKTHVGLVSDAVASDATQTSSRAGPAAYYFYAPVAALACVIIAAAVVAAVVAKKRSANSFATLAN